MQPTKTSRIACVEDKSVRTIIFLLRSRLRVPLKQEQYKQAGAN